MYSDRKPTPVELPKVSILMQGGVGYFVLVKTRRPEVLIERLELMYLCSMNVNRRKRSVLFQRLKFSEHQDEDVYGAICTWRFAFCHEA